MASMSGTRSVQEDLVRGTIAEVKQLTVDRLRKLLRSEELQVSGVKNELQTRLIAHIYDRDRRNDLDSLRRIRDSARGYPVVTATSTTTATQYNAYPSPYSQHTPASSASPNYYASPTPRIAPPVSFTMPAAGYSQGRMTFKTSPFFTIQKSLSSTIDLKVREATRDTARLNITLDDTTATRFQTDSNYRAMVFCALESYDNSWRPVDISFPQHSELRVNSTEVKANLKGLKNKPGSTRPVDITDHLRKKANFPNAVELVYALNKMDKKQKYLLVVNMVQRRPIDSLVDELKRGKYLSRDRVVRELQARANDDDIVATSSNMSLKDPVQMTRIQTPCRSTACKHTECFDAAVFLALQEQAPTWTCPICNKPAAWESLVVDQFVQNILDSTSQNTEQVAVEPDGSWHLLGTEENDTGSPPSRQNDSDDDDDLVLITDPASMTSTHTRSSIDPIRTPSLNSGSFSVAHRPSLTFAQQLAQTQPQLQAQSKKRPREEVIDLTLSDDDDEPPVSRMKRPSSSSHVSTDTHRPSGALTGPFRFGLPAPVQRTDSPGHYYEFDQFNTTF